MMHILPISTRNLHPNQNLLHNHNLNLEQLAEVQHNLKLLNNSYQCLKLSYTSLCFSHEESLKRDNSKYNNFSYVPHNQDNSFQHVKLSSSQLSSTQSLSSLSQVQLALTLKLKHIKKFNRLLEIINKIIFSSNIIAKENDPSQQSQQQNIQILKKVKPIADFSKVLVQKENKNTLIPIPISAKAKKYKMNAQSQSQPQQQFPSQQIGNYSNNHYNLQQNYCIQMETEKQNNFDWSNTNTNTNINTRLNKDMNINKNTSIHMAHQKQIKIKTLTQNLCRNTKTYKNPKIVQTQDQHQHQHQYQYLINFNYWQSAKIQKLTKIIEQKQRQEETLKQYLEYCSMKLSQLQPQTQQLQQQQCEYRQKQNEQNEQQQYYECECECKQNLKLKLKSNSSSNTLNDKQIIFRSISLCLRFLKLLTQVVNNNYQHYLTFVKILQSCQNQNVQIERKKNVQNHAHSQSLVEAQYKFQYQYQKLSKHTDQINNLIKQFNSHKNMKNNTNTSKQNTQAKQNTQNKQNTQDKYNQTLLKALYSHYTFLKQFDKIQKEKASLKVLQVKQFIPTLKQCA